MFGRKTTSEVLVVGAGPVGLFAALQLARRGVDVEIVDSQWRTAARSYALALHPRTLELFDEVDLVEPLLAQGRKVESVGYYDRTGRRTGVDLRRLESRYPFLLVAPQNLLEKKLEERLAAEGVEVRWSHRLAALELGQASVGATIQKLGKESTGYSVTSTEWVVEKTLQMGSKFILGADGQHSAVRRLSGIELDDSGLPQQFAVFECSSDRDPGAELAVILEESGTSALWPLAKDRFRWSFEIGEDEIVGERVKRRLAVQVGEETFPYLSPESLSDFLAERAPWFDAAVGEVHWSVGVRFSRRLAREFGRGPVSLLGDAAHTAGPVGVQSMNAGLADARELAEMVASIVKEGVGRESVDAFDRRRITERRRLLGKGIAVAKAAATPTDWILERTGRIPACVPALGSDLDKLLGQLGLELG